MSDVLPFTKMHGTGNDYVVLDAFRDVLPDPAELARRMTPRRFGAGADGLLVAGPSPKADLRMRMFNVDGSEAEMCGNGLRCLVKLAWERGHVERKETGTVETGAGILGWRVHVGSAGVVDRVTIDMGVPRLDREEIPMKGAPGPVRDEPLRVEDRTFEITAVSMGNPHAVTFLSPVASFPLERYGPLVETHPSFPRRTNAEFVEVVSRDEVRQRTWERGCGETFACGTGACAVVVAGVETGRLDRRVRVRLLGGLLDVEYRERDGHVLKTGPAVAVYEGRWPM